MDEVKVIDSERNHVAAMWDSEVFLLGGADRQQLADAAKQLLARVEAEALQDLSKLALQLEFQLADAGLRIGIVASSAADLCAKLKRAVDRLADPKCTQIRDVSGIYFTGQPLGADAKIAFLFPGEGSQYLGMMGDLAENLSVVRELLTMCDEVCAARPGNDEESTSRFFQTLDKLAPDERQRLERELRRIDNAMFSVFLGDWIIHHILKKLGVRCDVMAGHSAGELAALMATRCINGTDEQFAKLAVGFQTLGQQRPVDAIPSKLIALAKSCEVAQKVIDQAAILAGRELKAFVAMHNCPHQTVIVGFCDDMQHVEQEAQRQGLVYQQLGLEQPYHTPLFEPYMRTLRQIFDEMPFQVAEIPIYSCTTGQLFPRDPAEIRQLTVAHWESPVHYTELIENIYNSGVRCFVEVGPRNNLCAFTEDILRGRDCLILPTNIQRHSGITQLNHLVVQLSVHHVSVDRGYLYRERGLLDDAELPAQTGSVHAVEAAAMPGQAFASVAARRSATEATVSAYWQVMDQFLDTQSAIMQQYLRSRGSSTLPGARRGRRILSNRRSSSPGLSSASTSQYFPQSIPQAIVPARNYPLVHQIVELSPGQRIVMERAMDLEEDVFSDEHTVGGRELSRVDPNQHGLPVVPMTFTLEILCEVAQTLLPGKCVVAMENVRLFKWLSYEEGDARIRVTAEVSTIFAPTNGGESSDEQQIRIEAQLFHWRESEAEIGLKRPAATATLVLRDRLPTPPLASDYQLQNERPTTISLEILYKNLFHGDQFRGVRSLTRYGDNGIEAVIEALPREGLFSSLDDPEFIFDPVLLDVAMHPMCAWHLEQPDQSGRILLPIGIEHIEFFGHRPAVGTQFICRGNSAHESVRQFTHDFEVLDQEERVWCRLKGCHYWRFYLPFKEFNFHGPKDVYTLSDLWPEMLAAESMSGPGYKDEQTETSSCCVRFEVPTDLQNPTMQPVGAMVTLSDRELAEFKQLTMPHDKRTQWLFGRGAAKDAVRFLWRQMTGERLFNADVEIDHDEFGRPIANLRGRERPANFPHITLAHTGMLVAAIASTHERVGIDVERIAKRGDGFNKIAFHDQELQLLNQIEADQSEWATRFWCAKEAVGKALGRGLTDGPRTVQVAAADVETGNVLVQLSESALAEFPEYRGQLISVQTLRDGSIAAASTFCRVTQAANL